MSPVGYLLLQVAAATLMPGDLATSDPTALGERVLAGMLHRPIETVMPEPPGGLMLADIEYVLMLERPEIVPGGCVRRKWQANFRYRGTRRASVADLVSLHSREQVAVAIDRSCAAAAFATYSGIERPRALLLLARWRDWLASRGHGRITCSSDVDPGSLCSNDGQTVAALRRLTIWAMPSDRTFWLSGRGAALTKVVFDALPPRTVTVTEVIPPPA